MQLLHQLAVQDLVALADVLLMPEDDLSLAVVLKSPLFGLDDDDLFDSRARARHGRCGTRSERKAKDNPRFTEAADRLSRWLSRVDLMPPYEFFSRAARRRTGKRCASACSRGSDRRPPRRSMSFSISRSPMTARPRRRCKASSTQLRVDRRRDQARHGAGARRGPHHDGARRQGPAGADRVPAGHLHAVARARARASIRSRGRAFRRTRSAISCGLPAGNTSSALSRTAKARLTQGGASRNITGCSTSP